MVQFYDNAVALGGPVMVSGGHAQLALGDRAVDSHRLTATYSGAAAFVGSSTAIATTLTVTQAPMTVTTAPTASPIRYGQTLASSTLPGACGDGCLVIVRKIAPGLRRRRGANGSEPDARGCTARRASQAG